MEPIFHTGSSGRARTYRPLIRPWIQPDGYNQSNQFWDFFLRRTLEKAPPKNFYKYICIRL